MREKSSEPRDPMNELERLRFKEKQWKAVLKKYRQIRKIRTNYKLCARRQAAELILKLRKSSGATARPLNPMGTVRTCLKNSSKWVVKPLPALLARIRGFGLAIFRRRSG